MVEIGGDVWAPPSAQSRLPFLRLDLAPTYAIEAAAKEFARSKERLDVLSESLSSFSLPLRIFF